MDELATLVIEETKDKMAKSIEHVKAEFGAVRTGRATPALVESLMIDYYGTATPLKSLAGFTVPDAKMLVISPFDKSAMGAIEKAISASDLGITPNNDGQVIRLGFPPLTEERRKELVKVVRHKAEEGKVQVRNHRRSSRQELEQLEKDSSISTDEHERLGKEIEKLTHSSIEAIDELLSHKEHELLAV